MFSVARFFMRRLWRCRLARVRLWVLVWLGLARYVLTVVSLSLDIVYGGRRVVRWVMSWGLFMMQLVWMLVSFYAPASDWIIRMLGTWGSTRSLRLLGMVLTNVLLMISICLGCAS